MNEGRPCPRCGAQLGPVRLLRDSQVEVEVCPVCRGIWFDAGELDRVLAAVAADGARVDRLLLDGLAERHPLPEAVRYLPCPVCGKAMNRSAHGYRSGVVTDRCRADGIWLDGGELERLFDWVAAGGHVLDRQVAEERRQEEARCAARRQQSAAALGPTESIEDLMAGGNQPRRHSAGWLAEALADLLAGVR